MPFHLDLSENLSFGKEENCNQLCSDPDKPFRKRQILDSSKLKEFANNNSNWKKIAENSSKG